MRIIRRLIKNVKYFILGFTSGFRDNAVSYIEMELRELENVFVLLLMSSLIGLPSPPTTLSIRLLPHMIKEIAVVQSKSRRLDDIIGEVAKLFEI